MKKFINKLRKKDEPLPPPSRITADTVAEHREGVLAGGRKFKYPIQYTRRRLVINAIIISLTAIAIALIIGWWQLYPAQNTSEFMYRVTKVLPLPVAYVDGQPVLYSDYLIKYRGSVHFDEKNQQLNSKTEDGKNQIKYIKQQSLNEAIADAYAEKLSKSIDVKVDDKDIDAAIQESLQLSDGKISLQTYYSSLLDSYGWTQDEVRYLQRKGVVRRKVAYKMDSSALKAANKAANTIKNNPNVSFKDLASELSKNNGNVIYGNSGFVSSNNWDGGLAKAASELKKGESSAIIKSWDNGYYIVRLVDSNDKKVNYEYIQVPLSAFNKALSDVNKSGKVRKLISVDDDKKIK